MPYATIRRPTNQAPRNTNEGDGLMSFQEYLQTTGLANYDPYEKEVAAKLKLGEGLQGQQQQGMREQIEWMMKQLGEVQPRGTTAMSQNVSGNTQMYDFLRQLFGGQVNFLGPSQGAQR